MVPMVGMMTDTTGSPATRGCTSLSPGTRLGDTVPPPNVRSKCSCWTRAAAVCAHGFASIVSAVDSAQARQWYSGSGRWTTRLSSGSSRSARSKSCAPSIALRSPPTASTSSRRNTVKWHRYICVSSSSGEKSGLQ